MGSSSSKFKKYLQHGDEYAAMQVYQSSSELRKALQPNYSYGDHHNHNTPLHYAAKHAMKHLIRTFISDLGGNPNRRNGLQQTALHCVCNIGRKKSPSALERRAYSVILLLSWRGPILANGERERIEVNAKDQYGYTALHYAAQSGLRKCIEYLVAHGADVFLENHDGLTPCDLAVREGQHHVAQFLESKMVFSSGTPEQVLTEASGPRASSLDDEEDQEEEQMDEEEEVYSGLRAQDLQEAKDQLLVETADMLHVPLFTAEVLLRHAEWSKENLLEQWIVDPINTCRLAGIQPPYSALMRPSSISQFEKISREYHNEDHQKLLQQQQTQLPMPMPKSSRPPSVLSHLKPKIHSEASFIVDEELAEDGILCEICCDLMTPHPLDNEMNCGHKFCTKCWKHYLHNKIQEGNAHHILCPAFDCDTLVPQLVIERHVSPQMARKYLKFDINAFVETNKTIRWCPFPACQRAVNFAESNYESGQQTNVISHAVDCGEGHFFCWECGSDAHAPVPCSLWNMWMSRCNRVNPSELRSTTQDFQEAANCLWLVTHCKPCPKCHSPIQKNDGCNHMKCSKCKHDFCWVCLESWRKHSSATGGYFRCNRFTAFRSEEEAALAGNGSGAGSGKQLMSEKSRKLREINRFVHFFTRFKNHENSRRMEEPLLLAAKRKRELMQMSLGTDDSDLGTLARNTKFYLDGVKELLKARQILCGSYAYGFYLDCESELVKRSSENEGMIIKTSPQGLSIFEFMQNELEEATERLCEVIARPYLRTPRKDIIQVIHFCRRKRQEFLRACYRGLVPPESKESRLPKGKGTSPNKRVSAIARYQVSSGKMTVSKHFNQDMVLFS